MRHPKPFWRGLFFLFLITVLCGGMALPVLDVPARAAPQRQAATSVVISEFRTNGPNGGNDEFIELFNPTSSPVPIGGWQLWGSNSAGGTSNRKTIPAGVTLAIGQHYLIANNNYIGGVPGDTTYGTGIPDNGGIALIDPLNPAVPVDQVGMSNGSAYKEGTPLGSLAGNSDQSYERQLDISGSCTDANNNATDFFRRNPSDPQNSSSPITTCGDPTQTPSPTLSPTATNSPTDTSSPTSTSPALSGAVVISELRTTGPNGVNDEFVELYNRSSSSVSIGGLVIRKSNSCSPNSSQIAVIPAGVMLASGQHYLIGGSSYSGSVSVDQSASLSIANDGGIALLSGATVVDQVGMCATTLYHEGTPLLPLSTNTNRSYDRKPSTSGICADTNNNATDFLLRSPSDPQNSASTLTACGNPTIPPPTITPSRTPTNTRAPTNTPSIPPAKVVISEFRTTGPSGGNDEFIELYNRSTANVSIGNWVIRKSNGCSSNSSVIATIPGGVTLAPGQHYLIGGNSYSGSVLPNRTFPLSIANEGGIALFHADGVTVEDQVGLCTTTLYHEGTPLAPLSTSKDQSYDRKTNPAGKCRDTNNNVSDFIARSPSDPQNFGSSLEVCGNATLTPTRTRTPTPTRTVTRTRTPSRTPSPPPPPPLIAINEFVPRPGHDWNNDGVVNVGDEFIELLNHGVIDVNLSGYTLDDEANIGSTPFRLPSITLHPGDRRVFYGSETGLLLSDGGDGVRLIKPNGQLGDAFNYRIVRFPDQSYCRLPDNGGLDDWNENCFPTPGLQNALSGSVVNPPEIGGPEQLCPIADTLPNDFVLAECPPFGGNIWNPEYWDRSGWFDEKFLPQSPGKWNVFVD